MSDRENAADLMEAALKVIANWEIKNPEVSAHLLKAIADAALKASQLLQDGRFGKELPTEPESR